MTDQKKTPSGCDREGANKYRLPKPTKPKPFPQEPIMWQAHRDCIQRFQDNPTPVNRMVAQVIAAHWKGTFTNEVLR